MANAVSLPEVDIEGTAPAPDAAPASEVKAISPVPGKYAVTKPSGEVVLMGGDDVVAGAGGVRPATEAEYFGAAHPVSSKATAAVLGAARGLSFGTSDAAIVGTDRLLLGDASAEETRRALRIAKEASPNTSLVSELAGAVAPAFFGAPPVEAAASLGEGLVARGVSRAVAAAPRALGEGVAIGLGNQLSEDTLGNHKMVSEAYWNAGVKGGVIGLFMGVGGSVGIGAAGDKLGALFGKVEGGALRAEERAAEGGVYRTAATREAEATGEKGYFARRLENEGDIQSFKGATNAKTGDIRRLGIDVEAQEGVEARLGKMLREEGLTGPLVSQAEAAKRINAKLQEVGQTFRPLYTEADKAVQRPQMATITEAMEGIRATQAGKMYGDLELKGAEDSFARLEKAMGDKPSHLGLWEARKEMDGILRKSYARVPGGVPPVGEEAMRALRTAVNDELAMSVERAGKELGGTLGDQLRVANQMYGDLATVNKIATHQAALNASSNLVSLTDVIGASVGGVAGLATGGVNMVRRKFGNQIAAHVLGAASKIEMLQRAATKLDDLIGSGTRAFVDGSKGATRAVKPVTTAEVRALREATRSPEAVNARIAERLGDMPQYAPKTAQQISTGAARAAAWLQFALPKEAAPTSPVFNQRAPRPLSDTDLVRARATIETVEDGSVVIDRLRQGRLTAEHVAALKYVHPETYASIQKYLGDHAVELKPTLSVQQQFSLSMLFATPITEAMLPENIRAFQASFADGNQAPGQGGAGGVMPAKMSAGPVNGGGTRAMSMDRLEAGTK